MEVRVDEEDLAELFTSEVANVLDVLEVKVGHSQSGRVDVV